MQIEWALTSLNIYLTFDIHIITRDNRTLKANSKSMFSAINTLQKYKL